MLRPEWPTEKQAFRSLLMQRGKAYPVLLVEGGEAPGTLASWAPVFAIQNRLCTYQYWRYGILDGVSDGLGGEHRV